MMTKNANNSTIFICPNCKFWSGNMELTKEKHIPTPKELMNRPEMESISDEVLLCNCGIKHTWFTLEIVNSTLGE